jgi:hypothetical protein
MNTSTKTHSKHTWIVNPSNIQYLILNPSLIEQSSRTTGKDLSWQKTSPQYLLGVHGKLHLNSLPLGVMYMQVHTYERAVKEGEKLLKWKNEGVDDMGKGYYMPLMCSQEAAWCNIKMLFTTHTSCLVSSLPHTLRALYHTYYELLTTHT